MDQFFNSNNTISHTILVLKVQRLSKVLFVTSFVDEEKHRQVLAKAIYEEWYFKKQEEELKKKAEARRQQRVKQWEMQHVSFQKQ